MPGARSAIERFFSSTIVSTLLFNGETFMTQNFFSQTIERAVFYVEHMCKNKASYVFVSDIFDKMILDLNDRFEKPRGEKFHEYFNEEIRALEFILNSMYKEKSYNDLLYCLNSEAQRSRKMYFSDDGAWLWCDSSSLINLWDCGKQMTWIRCDGRTTADQRKRFFIETSKILHAIAVKNDYFFPISGKISNEINEYNTTVMLFYAPAAKSSDLLELLTLCRAHLEKIDEFQGWFAKPSFGPRTATWNWRWKTDRETYDEWNRGIHYSQKRRN